MLPFRQGGALGSKIIVMKLRNEIKTYYIKTYGCAMNYSDSDKLRFILKNCGLTELSDYKTADVIILNSCSVRQQAEDKILGWARKVKGLKDKRIILTGCMAIRIDRKTGEKDQKYEKSLKRKCPWIDFIVGDRDYENIPLLLKLKCKNPNSEYSLIQLSKFQGLFPISYGCNFFCSYCIVPYTRGKLINRSYKEIVKDITNFVKMGGKQITLIGQNVNSWKSVDNKTLLSFADLLENISKIKGDFWINFISSNPMDFSEELHNQIVNNPKIMKSMNLAVQSGSDSILKRMNRKYTVKAFTNIAQKIKKESPQFRLTTDIIVGFPGETEEDFMQTQKLLKTIDFDMVYLGKYSPRKGAVSEKFIDDVSQKVKEKRANYIFEYINQRRKKHNEYWLDKNIRVLITGGRRGISYYNHEVLFNSVNKESLIGCFVDCKVIGANVSGLIVETI